MKIKGYWGPKKVFIYRGTGWQEIMPEASQQLYNHSPDGFNWSYHGSGPAQLALALLMEIYTTDIALARYQNFKRDVIAGLPASDFEIEFDEDAWLNK